MRTFVIFDTHGYYKNLKGLLKAAEILKPLKGNSDHLQKVEDVYVVHIGDLLNCVSDSVEGDLKCLKYVRKGFIDLMLIGNHEHPYFYGPKFSGFAHFTEIQERLRKLYYRERLVAAYHEEGILFTHAGLSDYYSGDWDSAEDAALEINETWQTQPDHTLFSDIGYERMGEAVAGGILWSDWTEQKTSDFDQVVGHTPQKALPPVELVHPNGRKTICGDWGGKWGNHLAGCWVLPGGELDWVLYQGG
jgi:hypothetical protein